MSESNDESQDVPRLRLAWRSLERRSHTTGSGQILLERREFRLSDANDESWDFARLAFAWLTLERTVSFSILGSHMDARLSDGQFA